MSSAPSTASGAGLAKGYDYGGMLTGPVWIPKLYNGRNRTFFLFAWEKYQLHLGGVSQSTLPTAAERNGDFQRYPSAPRLRLFLVERRIPVSAMTFWSIHVPACPFCTTRSLIQGRRPRSRPASSAAPHFRTTRFPPRCSSAATQKLIAGLPLPNQAPTSTDVTGYQNNYSYAAVAPNTNTTYTIRIDQNLGDKSKLFGSYSTRQNFKLTAAPNMPEPFNSAGYVQTFTTHYTRKLAGPSISRQRTAERPQPRLQPGPTASISVRIFNLHFRPHLRRALRTTTRSSIRKLSFPARTNRTTLGAAAEWRTSTSTMDRV